ncbi:sulfite exporter TauE/SafE family protein [Pyrobaculum neutrophilum]|uniref:Probable membrane transporter protein n=1 Tax=Pyrobaculum neutrophilum (strain DSM 2338 / JCM 9278 / NBRC 100436 / V24Sta) TaxID=444157 RepID=B1Y8N2_PYRNV|nr:sulfite exporter TauE/SafE family protein [Pyrobaculum neutrophilum]ACB40111.1 protein of unknown function DUF81 [Pyrobaculum neutrophilum V24Sta]
MNAALLFAALFTTSVFAGFVGALTGLGGGVVLVPIYVLALGVPVEYAAGASLVSTIATSLATSAAYVRDRLTNVRIGMSLEISTTLGALAGSLTAAWIYASGLQRVVYLVFGAVLIFSSYMQWAVAKLGERPRPPPDRWTSFLKLRGRYYDVVRRETVEYYGVRWWLGALIMFGAGLVSGFLGIGGGALKVLAMDWAMALPIKVSTATSNFMIGVTAATGTAVYWVHGYIQPFLAAATALGVLAGAYVGSKVLPRLRGRSVRLFFAAVVLLLGVQMMLRGIWS